MAELTVIQENFVYRILLGFFQGIPVRIQHNKITDEIKFSGDDVARCLGFDSLNTMLSTDGALDVMGEWLKANPDKPLFGDTQSGAMFQSATM